MILKFQIKHADKKGWTWISDIETCTSLGEASEEEIEEYGDDIFEYGDPTLQQRLFVIELRDTTEKVIVIGSPNIYLCSDEGQTIDVIQH